MCGLLASFSPPGYPTTELLLERLHHRGPDAQGSLRIELPWVSVDLGMTRLKVVDQRDLVVPFDFREQHGVVLAFNGEIYNWKEQRYLLEGLGHVFRTNCDAEVLAAAWREELGPGCLSRLNGMWSFILIDVWEKELFIARDRAGEKPFYWTQIGEVIHCASEIKALPGVRRRGECEDAATLEFDCGLETTCEGVFAVPPGRYAHLKRLPERLEEHLHAWWLLPKASEVEPIQDFRAAVDATHEVLLDAIRLRYVAEVPVALQLSGGLDSAIIQAVCHSDALYCVDFAQDGVDNLSLAKLAAGGREVVPVTFTRSDLLEQLPRVAYHLDTPGTWTAVCQWFLNRKIAEDRNVIVLSGEGADELFGGYTRYRVLYWLERALGDSHLADYRPLMERALGLSDVLARMLDRGKKAWTLSHAHALLEAHGDPRGGLIADMARVDFYTTMQVLLRMADRMAAAFSLENRSPFFDYRLMELSARIPTSRKVSELESKAILRRVAGRLGVPSRIIAEKTKRGLFIPPTWGAGATWDRAWFAKLMGEAWREACCPEVEFS